MSVNTSHENDSLRTYPCRTGSNESVNSYSHNSSPVINGDITDYDVQAIHNKNYCIIENLVESVPPTGESENIDHDKSKKQMFNVERVGRDDGIKLNLEQKSPCSVNGHAEVNVDLPTLGVNGTSSCVDSQSAGDAVSPFTADVTTDVTTDVTSGQHGSAHGINKPKEAKDCQIHKLNARRTLSDSKNSLCDTQEKSMT